MNAQLPDTKFNIEFILLAERHRLVSLCARLSGSMDAAEDLAQETLIEAWRHREKVYDPQGYSKWLSAIAYNVCRRWSQVGALKLSHLTRIDPTETGTVRTHPYLEDRLADTCDLEMELERKELANLLMRAMSLLPAATSRLLVEKYIQGASLKEIATRLGISEGSVAVRLHRGRLALRRVLSTELSSEAAIYGLCDANTDKWQETSIWCPMCGQHRLMGRFTPGNGEFILVCTTCTPEPEDAMFQARWSELFSGIKGFKPALSRFMAHSHGYWRQGLLEHQALCVKSGHLTSVRMQMPTDTLPSMRDAIGLHIRCERCDSTSYITHRGLVRCLPEARRFWQEHPRLRSLPERELEVDGVMGIVTGFQSITGQARLDVISLRETLEVVKVHRS